jgi:hypothetical protein
MSLSNYRTNKDNIIAWSVGLFLNILNWGLVSWRIVPNSDQVILHYTIYFGTDWLGASWKVLYLPAFGLLVLLVNFAVGYYFWPQNKLISLSLNYLSAFFNILLLVVAVLLVLVNV